MSAGGAPSSALARSTILLVVFAILPPLEVLGYLLACGKVAQVREWIFAGGETRLTMFLAGGLLIWQGRLLCGLLVALVVALGIRRPWLLLGWVIGAHLLAAYMVLQIFSLHHPGAIYPFLS